MSGTAENRVGRNAKSGHRDCAHDGYPCAEGLSVGPVVLEPPESETLPERRVYAFHRPEAVTTVQVSLGSASSPALMCDLILSSVFERHPRLRAAIVEFELAWAQFVDRALKNQNVSNVHREVKSCFSAIAGMSQAGATTSPKTVWSRARYCATRSSSIANATAASLRSKTAAVIGTRRCHAAASRTTICAAC